MKKEKVVIAMAVGLASAESAALQINVGPAILQNQADIAAVSSTTAVHTVLISINSSNTRTISQSININSATVSINSQNIRINSTNIAINSATISTNARNIQQLDARLSSIEAKTTPSYPTAFSTTWLSGRTLFRTRIVNGAPAVEKILFREDGMAEITGLMNSPENGLVAWAANGSGGLYFSGNSSLFNMIVCESNPSYLKTHLESTFMPSPPPPPEVELFFFDEATALGMAGLIDSSIPPCRNGA